MSKGLLIASAERYSGKSSLAVGIGLELIDRGFKVGYMKPVGSYPIRIDQRKVDEDVYYIATSLGIDQELIPDLSPFFLNWDTLNRYMRKKPTSVQEKVRNCQERVARSSDVVIIEGAQNFVHGKILGLSALEVAQILDARVILLDTFNEELSVDRALSGSEYFSDRFLGVILNWVPERRMSFAENLFKRFLEGEGIRLLGAIPADRILRSITVSEIAASLGGKMVCAQDKGDELVESMMVGAMGQEQALRLFRKQANKVVVTGGDRPDIQLAALETPTKCLILTGGHMPTPMVVGQAQELGVPIIVVEYDTATAVEKVDQAISQQKVHHPKKLEKIRKFIKERVDVDSILEVLDLPPRMSG